MASGTCFLRKDIAYRYALHIVFEIYATAWSLMFASIGSQNSVIPRLHDQANIKQTSNNHQANVFKFHVHDVCSNCLMFASSYKRGINLKTERRGRQRYHRPTGIYFFHFEP